MNLYRLVQPEDFYRYAIAHRRGTWAPDPSPGVCPTCGGSRELRISPLIVVWEPGSDVIGDFTWPGFDDDVMVSDRVRVALEPAFGCLAFNPLAMLPPPTRPRPASARPRTKPRVAVPYAGPPLWDLQPTAWCGVHQAATGVRLTGECPTCGRLFWEPRIVVPHIVVDGRTWEGADIFRIDPYPGAVFCTERFKAFVEQAGFTNVAFQPRGEIGAAAAAVGPIGPFCDRLVQDLAGAPSLAPLSGMVPGQGAADAPPKREIARLADESPTSCPESMESGVEYLSMEIPDGEISANDLEFVRTALIHDWRCWLWQFVDLYGKDSYVTASLWPDGTVCTTYDPAHGRSPEQFIWVDYRMWRDRHATR